MCILVGNGLSEIKVAEIQNMGEVNKCIKEALNR